MAVRVVSGNNKGGSGKTANTINLAAALSEYGANVLVVDIDPQANASRRLGRRFDPAAPTLTIAEVLKENRPGAAAAAIVPCAWAGDYGNRIHLIPSRFDLENRISEAAVIGAVARLRNVLEGADDAYDFTLIDCPPSLGHLTQLALAASNYVLASVDPEYDGVEGATRLRDFVASYAGILGNPDLRMIGYLVSRLRSGVGAHNFQVENMPALFGEDKVWTPYIPERAPIKDAADAEVPLRLLGTSSGREMAKIYSELAQQLRKETGR